MRVRDSHQMSKVFFCVVAAVVLLTIVVAAHTVSRLGLSFFVVVVLLSQFLVLSALYPDYVTTTSSVRECVRRITKNEKEHFLCLQQ